MNFAYYYTTRKLAEHLPLYTGIIQKDIGTKTLCKKRHLCKIKIGD